MILGQNLKPLMRSNHHIFADRSHEEVSELPASGGSSFKVVFFED